MGETRAGVVLQNLRDLILSEEVPQRGKGVRTLQIDALVDTGAVMTLLPQEVVEKLGLKKIGRTVVTLANEEKVELDVAGDLLMTVAGREWRGDCLVGPPWCEPLLGQLVLERLDLIVDPLKQTLTPRPESPFLPTLKLK